MNALLFVRNGKKLVVETDAANDRGLYRELTNIDIQLHETLGLLFPHQKAYFTLLDMSSKEDLITGIVSCDVFNCRRLVEIQSAAEGCITIKTNNDEKNTK